MDTVQSSTKRGGGKSSLPLLSVCLSIVFEVWMEPRNETETRDDYDVLQNNVGEERYILRETSPQGFGMSLKITEQCMCVVENRKFLTIKLLVCLSKFLLLVSVEGC